MELKPGYKRTEIGVVPEGWVIKSLDGLFTFSGGYTASRDQLSSEGHCYLHYGDIHASSGTSVDIDEQWEDIPKLDIALEDVPSRSLLADGDVVFVDASEDIAGTCKHVVVVNTRGRPFISGLHTIVAKSTTGDLAHGYRRYCFQTASIRRQFAFYAVGTKVSGISKSNIRQILLPLPTLPEQHAIGEALGDMDALLVGLGRLIAKKRDLKHAAMQQLLTGQTRLAGYRGEWEEQQLGTVLGFQVGFPFSSTYFNEKEQGLRLVKNRDLKSDDQVFHYSGKHDSEFKVENGDVLVGMDGDFRPCIWRKGPALLNQRVGRIVPKDGLVPVFAFYALIAPLQKIEFATSGTTVKHLSHSDVERIEMRLPSTEEQATIAAVLADMDAEIAALEQRCDKTRDLKQAMMQELLTGRTRLI